MMKNCESDEDKMRLYYSYIKILRQINQHLVCEVPDRDPIKKLLEEIDCLHLKLCDKLLYKISKRIKYLNSECVYNRSMYFYCYILHSKFNEEFSPIDIQLSSNFDNIFSKGKPIQQVKIIFKDIDDIIKMDLSIIYVGSEIFNHISMYNCNNLAEDLIININKDLGRTYFYEQFFLWFEDYFKFYLKTMETLMNQDGFIPRSWRLYIALMAASAMRCEYLFKIIEEAFLEIGGDESWLIFGLDVIPEKLKRLSRINNLLAHQPWKIITEDIKELTTKRDQNDNTSWNLVEFVQAALIMVQHHKLAIIVDALHIKLKNVSSCHKSEKHNDNESKFGNGNGFEEENKLNIKVIHEEKVKNSKEDQVLKRKIKDAILKNLEVINDEEKNSKDFSPIKERQSDSKSGFDDHIEKEKETCVDFESLAIDITVDFDKHVNKYCNIYHDFDAHGDEFHSYLEFNWSDHAYYILHNLYPKGVDCFNSEIEYVTTLTTNSLGEENRQLNTFPIRYSISCYIEKILGYIHEDYDYSNVNKLLVVGYKKFIKNVSCYPKRLSPEDFDMMNYAFNVEEILHITLLVSIVKSRTQLTYLASSLYEIIKTID